MSAWEVSGRTRWIAQLGDPIEGVGMPRLMAPLLRERGLDVGIVPIEVGAGDLAGVLAAFRGWRNLVGAGITFPHKEAAPALLDSLDEEARLLGAVNLLRREADGSLHGGMVDGEGFVAGLRESGHDPAGVRVLLVGAGGTARAIAFALAAAGVASLRVANRTPERAERLVADLRAARPGAPATAGPPDPAGADLIVNATSLGMRPEDPAPLALDGGEPGAVVAEVVLGAGGSTPLLEDARRRGLRAHPGVRMLAAQLGLALEFLELDRPRVPTQANA